MAEYSASHLFGMGEEWRTEQPGLWAILRGRGGEVRIAQLLGWPIKRVHEHMMELSRVGLVKQNNMGTWKLNEDNELAELYHKVRELYQAIDRRLVEQYPDKVNIEELSTVVRADARAAKNAAKGNGPQPTEVQLKMLTVIHEAFGRTQFTPLAMGKAQGFTTAGWSKKYLETLAKKGFVEAAQGPGRGSNWRLTAAGVEWATR